MTLATATLERFTTITAALTPVTETPVPRRPTGTEANNDVYNVLVYVTSVEGEDRDSVVGTVQTVRPSPIQDGWFRRDANGRNGVQRVYGAVLNDPMVNGRYYRSLTGSGSLVRFNDEDHAGDRHLSRLPLSILATNGVTWPVPNDGMTMWDDSVPYIEVEAPTGAAEVTDAHQFVEDTTITGPTRGIAEAEPDGRVLLNPDIEVGGMYVFWSTRQSWPDRANMVEGRICTAITDGTPTFQYFGYWAVERFNDADTPYFYSSRRTILDGTTENKGWAKLAMTGATEVTTTDADVTRLNDLRSAEAAEFSEFNESTNTLARDNDWCSEYEGIVEPLGMEGRTKTVHDYDVELSVDFSFEVDSVSSRIDTEVGNQYDIPGISLDSATFTGTASVTITLSDRDEDDDLEDYIDTSDVEDALNREMSGVSSIDVNDWSIQRSSIRD